MNPDLQPDRFLTLREAAQYLRLPENYLRNQVKRSTGPRCVAPSRGAKFFRLEDLDAWRRTWLVRAPRLLADG